MLNCVIIDDEQPAINIIVNYLKQVPYLNLVATTTSPVEGLQIINNEFIDLVFLDIQMPEITGLEFIRSINKRCKVIIISAYSEFALDGFELEVIDYLLKPVPLSRFIKAVQKAKEILEAAGSKAAASGEGEFILIKGDAKGKLIKVEIDEIDYIEGTGNYVTINCGPKKILSLINMKSLEDRLPPQKFIRVHKSFIVPISRIAMIDGNTIILKHQPKAEIVIGKVYKQNLLDVLKSRLIS
jgi:two-component system LytT family response regulator